MIEDRLALSDAKMRQLHRPHPRCACCGRAKYKSPTKGAIVRKNDPYAFCRSKKCSLYGVNQTTLVLVGDLLLDISTQSGLDSLVWLARTWIQEREGDAKEPEVIEKAGSNDSAPH